ncbi:MAG: DUF1028 domain-containing protein [Planctomycetota bacterium]
MLFLRALLSILAAAVFSSSLRATWSIILIDTRTGEIAIASATCLTGFDLQREACVVLVGRGAAAAQSFVDLSGVNRMLIFAQLGAGTDPSQILAQLAASDSGHQSRQYGIVDTQGRAVGFSGTGAGAYAGHLTGQIGTIVYAVQGNVLTGQAVVTAAEQAIRTTPGDLAEKLMAAMQASRMFGGDGRCSCNPNFPTQCGAPPPSFSKSAHIGYLVVARPGDTDGVCNNSVGCASGSYYLNLNVANQQGSSPEPIDQLRQRFLNWRLQTVLRADHFLSSAVVEPARLLDDGVTATRLRIELRDWRGVRLPFGGAQVAVTQQSGPAVAIGAIVDHGDGSYTVPLGPANVAGAASFRVVVDDGQGPVQLSPSPQVEVGSESLWLSRGSIDAVAGGSFDAVLRGGAAFANRSYLMLASTSGTTPGVQLSPGVTLPLVPDGLTFFLLDLAPSTTSLLGPLDASGRATVPFAVPPMLFASLPGGRLDFAWLSLAPIDFASNPAGVALR